MSEWRIFRLVGPVSTPLSLLAGLGPSLSGVLTSALSGGIAGDSKHFAALFLFDGKTVGWVSCKSVHVISWGFV